MAELLNDTDLDLEVNNLIESTGEFAIVCLPDDRFFVYNKDQIIYKYKKNFRGTDYFRILPWDEGEKGYEEISMTEYLEKIEYVIKELKKFQHRKVVISKVKRGKIDFKILSKRISGFFKKFPGTFRFLYYTDKTGFWVGASPELLIEEIAQDEFKTMALAGTRTKVLGKWDEKNQLEHEIVVSFITEQLQSLNFDVRICPRETLDYGNIEHLCTPIFFKGKTSFDKSLKALNPTPALCGYPIKYAKNMISRIEKHSRGCYGGVIEFRNFSSGLRQVYVNLRCARFDRNGNWIAFAGGGIMPDSNPCEEWTESENKMNSLISMLFE